MKSKFILFTLLILAVLSVSVLFTSCSCDNELPQDESESVTYTGKANFYGMVIDATMVLNKKDGEYTMNFSVYDVSFPFYKNIINISGTAEKEGDEYKLSYTDLTTSDYCYGHYISLTEYFSEEMINRMLNYSIVKDDYVVAAISPDGGIICLLLAEDATYEPYELVCTMMLPINTNENSYPIIYDTDGVEDLYESLYFVKIFGDGFITAELFVDGTEIIHSITGVEYGKIGVYDATITLRGGEVFHTKVCIEADYYFFISFPDIFSDYGDAYYIPVGTSLADFLDAGVTFNYYEEDGSENNASGDVTPNMVSGYDSSKAGPKEITITYGEGSKAVSLKYIVMFYDADNIKAVALNSNVCIEVEKDTEEDQILLEFYFSDGSSRVIALSEVTVVGLDLSKTGIQKCTVSYEDAECEMVFFVYDNEFKPEIGVGLSTTAYVSNAMFIYIDDEGEYALDDEYISYYSVDGYRREIITEEFLDELVGEGNTRKIFNGSPFEVYDVVMNNSKKDGIYTLEVELAVNDNLKETVYLYFIFKSLY